ncbi:MAG: anthrone oxygenase family protein [Planctomycetota bacterium]
MLDLTLITLTATAALAAAMMAGTFFAFSNFIMPGLKRAAPAHGIEAMQQINITVMNPGAMGFFIGGAVLGVALIALAGYHHDHPAATFILAGALLYTLGTFVVTAAGNVPLNEALAKHDANSPEALSLWQRYLPVWTRWNTLRTLAATAATACYVVALVRLAAW